MKKPFAFPLFFVLLIAFGCGEANTDKNTSSEQDVATNEKSDSTNPGTTKKNIVFFGNSLTAGYGVEPTEAFPALIQEKIDSLQLPYQAINAGVSGETTAGGYSRIDWILRQPVSVFVLELGGNDGLRGLPIEETQKNLQNIMDKVKAKYPEAVIILAGMQVPPNMGNRYASAFRTVFTQLAEKNKVALIPFLLENVGGIAALNQPDGIHPTPEGHQIVAQNVWQVLKPIL